MALVHTTRLAPVVTCTICWSRHILAEHSSFLNETRISGPLLLLCRKSFEAGKVFGRRQTLWDAIVTVIAGQERNAMGLLLKVVFSALVNFTVGMVSSIFVFVFKLPWILADYRPGWVSLCLLAYHLTMNVSNGG